MAYNVVLEFYNHIRMRYAHQLKPEHVQHSAIDHWPSEVFSPENGLNFHWKSSIFNNQFAFVFTWNVIFSICVGWQARIEPEQQPVQRFTLVHDGNVITDGSFSNGFRGTTVSVGLQFAASGRRPADLSSNPIRSVKEEEKRIEFCFFFFFLIFRQKWNRKMC